jgi:sulfite exporter TauE/SafE
MTVDAVSASALAGVVLVAVLHTAMGPDHYLPFVMLARARGWSLQRTLVVTGACGVGHVASSLLLGGIGLAMGSAVGTMVQIESRRGEVAAWALVAFGLAYALWGVRHARRRRSGLELHAHPDDVHVHPGGGHRHAHAHEVRREGTFWALFIVFVLGPCEPLIPFFVLPASQGRFGLALLMALVFGLTTLGTMLAMVAAATAGVQRVRLGALEPWSHALAGTVLVGSGGAMLILGL